MNFIPKIEYIQYITGDAKTLTFGSPPEGDPFNESYEDNKVVTRSNNGTPLTQFNYTRKNYALSFIFQSETVRADVITFRDTAKRGVVFKYFPSSDEVDYEEFYLEGNGISFKRPIPSATLGEFEYDFSINMSRPV